MQLNLTTVFRRSALGGVLAVAGVCLASTAYAQAGPAYFVAVNLQPLLPAVQNGYFVFSFDTGNLAQSLAATATITKFTAPAGALTAADPLGINGPAGAVTGSLANTLTLMNTDPGGDNSFTQSLKFGGVFSFNLALSGPAFNKSLTSSSITDFDVVLYDALGNPVGTPSGVVADISVAPNAVVTPSNTVTTNFPSTGTPIGTVGPIPAIGPPPTVPESSSLGLLLAGGLLGLAVVGRRTATRRQVA